MKRKIRFSKESGYIFRSKSAREVETSCLVIVIVLIIILFSQLCQCEPARRERWNPYYYPTARSITSVSALSQRPKTQPTKSPPSSPRSRPVIRISTIRAPRSSANRRAAQSHLPALSNALTFQIANNSSTPSNQTFFGIDVANFDLGNATAITLALNEFIKSAEHVVREVLMHTQDGLLRVIGQVDQGADMFQRRIQDSTLRLAFAGQKAASQTYKSLPSFANKLLQRLTAPPDNRSREQFSVQLNEAIKNLRQLKKMLSQALEEHEKDFHNVFQERFTQINQYLRVPELPKRPLAWFS